MSRPDPISVDSSPITLNPVNYTAEVTPGRFIWMSQYLWWPADWSIVRELRWDEAAILAIEGIYKEPEIRFSAGNPVSQIENDRLINPASGKFAIPAFAPILTDASEITLTFSAHNTEGLANVAIHLNAFDKKFAVYEGQLLFMLEQTQGWWRSRLFSTQREGIKQQINDVRAQRRHVNQHHLLVVREAVKRLHYQAGDLSTNNYTNLENIASDYFKNRVKFTALQDFPLQDTPVAEAETKQANALEAAAGQLKALYRVSTGAVAFIKRSIGYNLLKKTEKANAEYYARQEETLFNAAVDLLPDAVAPHKEALKSLHLRFETFTAQRKETPAAYTVPIQKQRDDFSKLWRAIADLSESNRTRQKVQPQKVSSGFFQLLFASSKHTSMADKDDIAALTKHRLYSHFELNDLEDNFMDGLKSLLKKIEDGSEIEALSKEIYNLKFRFEFYNDVVLHVFDPHLSATYRERVNSLIAKRSGDIFIELAKNTTVASKKLQLLDMLSITQGANGTAGYWLEKAKIEIAEKSKKAESKREANKKHASEWITERLTQMHSDSPEKKAEAKEKASAYLRQEYKTAKINPKRITGLEAEYVRFLSGLIVGKFAYDDLFKDEQGLKPSSLVDGLNTLLSKNVEGASSSQALSVTPLIIARIKRHIESLLDTTKKIDKDQVSKCIAVLRIYAPKDADTLQIRLQNSEKPPLPPAVSKRAQMAATLQPIAIPVANKGAEFTETGDASLKIVAGISPLPSPANSDEEMTTRARVSDRPRARADSNQSNGSQDGRSSIFSSGGIQEVVSTILNFGRKRSASAASIEKKPLRGLIDELDAELKKINDWSKQKDVLSVQTAKTILHRYKEISVQDSSNEILMRTKKSLESLATDLISNYRTWDPNNISNVLDFLEPILTNDPAILDEAITGNVKELKSKIEKANTAKESLTKLFNEQVSDIRENHITNLPTLIQTIWEAENVDGLFFVAAAMHKKLNSLAANSAPAEFMALLEDFKSANNSDSPIIMILRNNCAKIYGAEDKSIREKINSIRRPLLPNYVISLTVQGDKKLKAAEKEPIKNKYFIGCVLLQLLSPHDHGFYKTEFEQIFGKAPSPITQPELRQTS